MPDLVSKGRIAEDAGAGSTTGQKVAEDAGAQSAVGHPEFFMTKELFEFILENAEKEN